MFLIILEETLTHGYKAEYLDLISLIYIFFGVSIIISKNPILSVLFLICLFSGISLYLIMLGLYFIGISYLLVYVGAISILFLFILMLINVRISELLTDNKNSIPLAVIAVLSFNSSVQEILPYSITVFNIISSYLITSVKDFIFSDIWSYYIKSSFNILGNTNFLKIAKVKSKIWDANLAETSQITSIGNIMYTGFSILLLITSLILLLAMVGTIVITINKSNLTTTSVNSNTFIYTSAAPVIKSSLIRTFVGSPWNSSAIYCYNAAYYKLKNLIFKFEEVSSELKREMESCDATFRLGSDERLSNGTFLVPKSYEESFIKAKEYENYKLWCAESHNYGYWPDSSYNDYESSPDSSYDAYDSGPNYSYYRSNKVSTSPYMIMRFKYEDILVLQKKIQEKIAYMNSIKESDKIPKMKKKYLELVVEYSKVSRAHKEFFDSRIEKD